MPLGRADAVLGVRGGEMMSLLAIFLAVCLAGCLAGLAVCAGLRRMNRERDELRRHVRDREGRE